MPEHAPDFVYTIYIRAAAETVWNALIDPEMTRRYWGHYNASDWKRGSRWEHIRCDGSGQADLVGKVLEIDPPSRLVVSWAEPEDDHIPEKHSRVTYLLKQIGPETRLTVTHSGLESKSAMARGISEGWPAVLSNLKTLLETGDTLEVVDRHLEEVSDSCC